MAKSIFAGMTDYSHQSFEDIMNDLSDGESFVTYMIDTIEGHINESITSGYWQKQPYDFKEIISYSITHYKTTKQELKSLVEEIRIKVQKNHCRRLENISTVAQSINVDIGKYWHNEYNSQDYGNPDFFIIEKIYGDTRDTAVSLLNYSNISDRLKDFVGKTSNIMDNERSANFANANFGNNTVVVVGNHNAVNPNQVNKNDLEALESLLVNNQVLNEDIEEVKAIVQSEKPDEKSKILGPRANGWISKMVGKSLDGTWSIGIGAAGKLLADGIKYYYGLF